MRRITILVLSIAALSVVAFYFFTNHQQQKQIVLFGDAGESVGAEGNLDARAKWELMRLADPATGKIPDRIRARELAYAATLPKAEGSSDSRYMSATPVFSPRGPWNVGGRTRSIAVDITNDSIILCGSVNGGVWRSTDAGATWTLVSGKDQIPAISCIVQDQRSGHTNTWYYSTGEDFNGSSASATGALYIGNGIYKSTDGGITWSVLSSTFSTTPNLPLDKFDLNWDLAIDTTDHDVIYDATTLSGIQMSIDGGNTWVEDLNTQSLITDVQVSPTGIVYASASSDDPGGMGGLWRKQNVVWTKISPANWDTTTFNRYVIAINPSNENEVYFLGGDTPNHGRKDSTFVQTVEWNSLWKYTYLSGDGSGSGGLWEDRSQNLPGDTNLIGTFYTQGGYDLIIKVNPDSSNIVYIGGTNLYRSKSAFADSNHTTFIGGYDPTSSLPFYRNYPNHHPDQHNFAFLHSDHHSVIQTNDGGLYKTTDITRDSVHWQQLNNGYITAQFYTVALDHGTASNNILVGGMQDDGSWFTNNSTLISPWTQPGAGDGSFCAIPDGHPVYYISRQQGSTAKMALDNNGNVTSYRRIDPIDGLKRDDYLFVNPFILDPNNNNKMFMAAGNSIWRNDSLSSIALSNEWDSISQGWFKFPDSVTGSVVTALAMSKNPAGRLYYGTSVRRMYKVDNPYSSSPTPVEITGTFSNKAIFPANGYMNCIAVDPTDEDNVMVVFSNYGITNLFYSNAAGVGWKNISGNLGVNVSTRWAAIIPVTNGTVYLVGTSVGLFGTSKLDSTATVWTQLDPGGIGNMVVDMIDYRASDGLVAIATHGRGIYTTHITEPLGLPEQQPALTALTIYPNPSSSKTMISFSLTKAENISLKLFNSQGELVETIVQNKLNEGKHQFLLDRKSRAAGIYFVTIHGESTKETRKVIFMN